MNGRAWTLAEHRVLQEMAKSHPDEQIAVRLGRSAEAVRKRRQELRIRGHKEWDEARQSTLRSLHAAGHSIESIAKTMGRSWWSIENQMRRMNLPHSTSAHQQDAARRQSPKEIRLMLALAAKCGRRRLAA